MRKTLIIVALTAWNMLSPPGFCQEKDTIYQASTINALIKGVYDGDLTYEELKKYGDFGLGTFNNLDGEMVALDGRFYQIKADGKVYPVHASMRTPFATVTFFEADRAILINRPMSCERLQSYLDSLLPSINIFYSIKIEGDFDHIRFRSVPRQEKPYKPLSDALKKETVFGLNRLKGTLVGFRMPGYIEGLNVPGYHFHLITEKKSMGGHLLDCRLREGRIEIDLSSGFHMNLPETPEFRKTDLETHNNISLDKPEN